MDETTQCGMDDVVASIAVIQLQESTSYLRSDYSTMKNGMNHAKVLDGTWRQRIVEWMFSVVDHCSLRRDSVAVAAYYLDLAVEHGIIQSRQDFQLAAMTGLQLAIKVYDSTIVKLDSMIKLGRGLFTEQDVVDMELKILRATICFLRQFLCILPSSVSPVTMYMIGEVTRFISEISVRLYKFVSYPSSAVAYAGMLLAMERIDSILLPQHQRKRIFETFLSVANLRHNSPMILEIMNLLHSSLDKNISLQDLMLSIDQQCLGAYGFSQQALTAQNAYESGMNFNTFTGSPRDVSTV